MSSFYATVCQLVRTASYLPLHFRGGGFDSVDFKLIGPCTMCVKKKSTEIPPPPTNLIQLLNENEGLLHERIQ
jgi:hypothetical protein